MQYSLHSLIGQPTEQEGNRRGRDRQEARSYYRTSKGGRFILESTDSVLIFRSPFQAMVKNTASREKEQARSRKAAAAKVFTFSH